MAAQNAQKWDNCTMQKAQSRKANMNINVINKGRDFSDGSAG